MFLSFIALASGSLLLNFSSPEKYEPFILVSLLLSLALIPILLTKRKAPKFKKLGYLKIKELYKISPLGSISMLCNGFIHSAIFTLTAVYAAAMNFTIFEISLLIFLITVAGGIFQLPIGFYSDKGDRRLIIVFCTFAASIFCFLAILASGTTLENMYLASSIGVDKIMFFIYVILYAGMALPIFSLTLAYVNDYIPKEKFVAAGAGMQLVFGIGAMFGPIFCTFLMTKYGTNGFFVHLLIFHVLIGLFGMFRMTKRPYKDNPESTFTPLPRNITPLGIELDPTTGADISNKEK